MRLSTRQVEQIRLLARCALPDGFYYELRLFGSRTDDRAKGGDVDLYLEVDGLSPAERIDLKHSLRGELEEALDIPVDLVVQDRSSPLKLVSQIAKRDGVRL